MESRKCKTKGCPHTIPADSKYKYCEGCRDKQVKGFKGALGTVAAVAGTIGTVVVAIATKGKVNLKK